MSITEVDTASRWNSKNKWWIRPNAKFTSDETCFNLSSNLSLPNTRFTKSLW